MENTLKDILTTGTKDKTKSKAGKKSFNSFYSTMRRRSISKRKKS